MGSRDETLASEPKVVAIQIGSRAGQLRPDGLALNCEGEY